MARNTKKHTAKRKTTKKAAKKKAARKPASEGSGLVDVLVALHKKRKVDLSAPMAEIVAAARNPGSRLARRAPSSHSSERLAAHWP